MRNRVTKPEGTKREAFGLVAWLEKTKITLPLKGVECRFNVCGDVLNVEIDQVFQQNSSQPLDCLYSFPLPASAAVYRCEMHLNGRVVRARVEEREAARKIAEEKKAEGYRTALVEMERDNLFTLSLGNVQPGDLVVIRFAYFETLTRLADWTSFNIPFCPGIRYIPGKPLLRAPLGRGVVDDTDQVPDASRISPPRIDALHPDAAYLSVEGTVEDPLRELKDISSPSHPVLVRNSEGNHTVAIADLAAVPDGDFVLRWTESVAAEVRPIGWLARKNDETFAMVRLRAPEDVAAANDYAQDFYFLIDRSGSMGGVKWEKAVHSFRAFLGVLGAQDRVWATFFETGVRDLAEKPLPVKDVLADRSVKNLESLGVAGGTELLPALEHVIPKIGKFSAERPASLILITDGQVGNESAILQALARHAQLQVHVFGIDFAINDGFLKKLAAQHHGTSCLLSPRDDIAGAVMRLGNRLRRPVLTSIRIEGAWESAGQELPDLHAGEVLVLPLRANSQEESSTKSLHLVAQLPGGGSRQYDFALANSNAEAVPLLWSRRRIDFFLAQGNTQGAISLAKASNLVCEGAAFIAWDETEKVPVSTQEVYQPAMLTQMFVGGMAAPAGAQMLCELTAEAPARFASKARAYSAPQASLMERLRRRLHVEPQTDGDWERCRRKLEQDILFQSPAGQQLLELLQRWIQARPDEVEARQRRVLELQIKLERAVKQSAADRLNVIHQWLEQFMTDELKDKALELFSQMDEGQWRVGKPLMG
jgi:Ca-activated chloride channel family protein